MPHIPPRIQPHGVQAIETEDGVNVEALIDETRERAGNTGYIYETVNMDVYNTETGEIDTVYIECRTLTSERTGERTYTPSAIIVLYSEGSNRIVTDVTGNFCNTREEAEDHIYDTIEEAFNQLRDSWSDLR